MIHESTELIPQCWAKRPLRVLWPASCAGNIGRVILLIACVASISFVLGEYAGAVQDHEKVIRADAVVAGRYKLVGPNGKIAALLHTKGEGEVLLSFYESDGSLRLGVGISPLGEPSLKLYDRKLLPQLSLRIDAKDQTPRLMLANSPFRRLGEFGCRPDRSQGDYP